MQAWGGDVLLTDDCNKTPRDYAIDFCRPQNITDALEKAEKKQPVLLQACKEECERVMKVHQEEAQAAMHALTQAQENLREAEAQYKKQKERIEKNNKAVEKKIQEIPVFAASMVQLRDLKGPSKEEAYERKRESILLRNVPRLKELRRQLKEKEKNRAQCKQALREIEKKNKAMLERHQASFSEWIV